MSRSPIGVPVMPVRMVVSRTPVAASWVNSPVADEANKVTSRSVKGVAWADRLSTSMSGLAVAGATTVLDPEV